MRLSILALIACSLTQACFCQEFPISKMDAYFKALADNDKVMGSICISRNGANIYNKSIGFSDIESKRVATQNSTYKIGSISKSFTAVMIFQAIEQGKLNLSTTLDNFFPSIKNAETITIDNLLCHRSGIANFTDNNFSSWSTEAKSREQMLKIIADGGTIFAPNDKTKYSNSNYVLLSYILEIINDKPFSEILRSNIVTPLKLANTYFDISGSDASLCRSYKYFDKWRIESDTDPSVTMGAGGIISTTSDLNTFFHALFSEKLINKKSLTQMTTINEGLGRGLFQMPFGSKIGYGHTGGVDGFSSVAIYIPDDKIAYSFTSNGSYYATNNISIAALSAVYNVPFDTPDFTTISLTSGDLDKYLGVYSSEQLPIKITVTKRDKTLVAQGTGQPSFDLSASAEHIFKFDAAAIAMTFNPEKGTMMLMQGGGSFLLKRE